MQVRRCAVFLSACTPALILVSAAAAQSPAAAPPPYVVLGAQGPVARAIMIPDASNSIPACPRIEVDGTPKAMTIRAEPGTDFNIRICEFVLGSAKSATIAGQALPLPPEKVETIAVFGDTGCRIKAKVASAAQSAKDLDEEDDEDEAEAAAAAAGNKKPKVQDCNNTDDWPFAPMSTTIANAKPNLVIHVGDYLYRESACPPGYWKDCGETPHNDNWLTWAADFFIPAADLLQAAPWIVTRGNHETCKRAGLGYALLLDPTPVDVSGPPKCPDTKPPLPPFRYNQYSVNVGGRSFIMLDSSDASDDCVSGCKDDWYEKQFEAMKPAPGTWLITHKPIWGFTNSKGNGIRNMELQAALDNKTFNNKPPAGIDLVLSGHIHLWEAIGFADERSPQFVLGDGSTKLAHKITEDLVGQPIGGTTVAAATTEHRFGYTIFEPSKKGKHWDATFYDTSGKAKQECKVKPSEVSCEKQ